MSARENVLDREMQARVEPSGMQAFVQALADNPAGMKAFVGEMMSMQPPAGPPQAPIDDASTASGPPQAPIDDASTSSGPPQAPIDDASTSSGPPQAPIDDASTSSGPPQAPIDDASTTSGLPQDPIDDASTSSGPPQAPIDDASTSSGPLPAWIAQASRREHTAPVVEAGPPQAAIDRAIKRAGPPLLSPEPMQRPRVNFSGRTREPMMMAIVREYEVPILNDTESDIGSLSDGGGEASGLLDVQMLNDTESDFGSVVSDGGGEAAPKKTCSTLPTGSETAPKKTHSTLPTGSEAAPKKRVMGSSTRSASHSASHRFAFSVHAHLKMIKDYDSVLLQLHPATSSFAACDGIALEHGASVTHVKRFVFAPTREMLLARHLRIVHKFESLPVSTRQLESDDPSLPAIFRQLACEFKTTPSVVGTVLETSAIVALKDYLAQQWVSRGPYPNIGGGHLQDGCYTALRIINMSHHSSSGCIDHSSLPPGIDQSLIDAVIDPKAVAVFNDIASKLWLSWYRAKEVATAQSMVDELAEKK
jgi:hypothetical protein